jgi:xylose isomerase
MNVPELTLMMLEVIRAGGFTTGGMNFDAKIRRQSLDPDDLLHAHVNSMDACARGLINAAKIVETGTLDAEIKKRYAGWDKPESKAMLEKGATLESIAARVHRDKIEPQPKSGRQEYLEGLLNNV